MKKSKETTSSGGEFARIPDRSDIKNGNSLQNQETAVTVEAVASNELTSDEWSDRLNLERKVERAFYQAGLALKELRDRRLYRSNHVTFEEYCLKRFGFERRHPYRLIDAAGVFDNLISMCPNWTQMELDAKDDEMYSSVTMILPTNECQVRPLVALSPDLQRSCWQEAVEKAGGKVPSGRVVRDIVDKIKTQAKTFVPFTVGEVCQLIPKDHGSFVLGVLNLSKNKLKTIVGLTLQPLLISKRYSLLKFKP